jgi:hypothetical protein
MTIAARIAGLLLAGACAAQTPKFLLPAGNIAAGRDLSGDGVPDVVLSFSDALGSNGLINVYSGYDGALLASISGAPGAQLGKLIAVVGDTNGDGVADLVAAGATSDFTIVLGAVWTTTTVASPFVPTLLADVGDVDADGRGDFAVGIAGTLAGWTINTGCQCNFSPGTGGVLAVVSGATYGLLSWTVGAVGDPWPKSVVAVGDVNQDGVGDIAVGSAGRAGQGNIFCFGFCGYIAAVPASIQIRSGTTGALLAQRLFSPLTDIALVAPGDVDMDGTPDVACRIGSSMTPVFGRSILMLRGSDLFELWANFMLYSGVGGIAGPGQMDDVFAGDVVFGDNVHPLPRVRCLSGFGGVERWTIYGPVFSVPTGFGRQVVAAGDLDADGRGDFVVGSLAASYVYLGATLGVEQRFPGCSASGAPPTLHAVPTVPGLPSVLRGVGAPPYPNVGTVLASLPGPSILTLPPGVLGASDCVVDLDPAFFFALGATISESQNAAGVRGGPGLPAPPPGYPTTDWVVPDHWYLPIQLPNDPAWVGFALRLQAAFFPAVGTPTLTNSVQLTIVAP